MGDFIAMQVKLSDTTDQERLSGLFTKIWFAIFALQVELLWDYSSMGGRTS